MKIIFLIDNIEYREKDGARGRCQWAIFNGLKSLGHEVPILIPAGGLQAIKDRTYEALFIWNGIKGHRGKVCKKMRTIGGRAYVMERGFFDRFNYTQIDHAGFSHMASWASKLTEAAPADGKARFDEVAGPIVPIAPRRTGYVLILGQTGGDSQLNDSELRHPCNVIDAVQDAMPSDVPILFRQHPHYKWHHAPGRTVLSPGKPLREEIDGARFVVTINSNSGNEALAFGCPVLCFGPALYAMGGVALETHVADLATDLQRMLDGWHPQQSMVDNYLYHLACRQYGLGELRQGDCLRRIMEQ